jgi:hypothetical protein
MPNSSFIDESGIETWSNGVFRIGANPVKTESDEDEPTEETTTFSRTQVRQKSYRLSKSVPTIVPN